MSDYVEDSLVPNEYEYVYFDDDKIYTYNSDEDNTQETEDVKEAEDWIDKHNEMLHYIYKELQHFPLCNKATFADFCEYMLYVSDYTTSDIQEWMPYADFYAFRFSNNRKPTLKEFAAHHIYTILSMYNFIIENSSLSLGPVSLFIEYAFIYSNRELN